MSIDKNSVLIRFKTNEQCTNFINWFSNAGEQVYFQDMEDADEVFAGGFEYFDNLIVGKNDE